MAERAPSEPWLPDLCRLPRLAVMLGMAELVVVVLALAPGGAHWDIDRFVTGSAFSLWLALTASVLLCVSRQWLSKLSQPVGAAVALFGSGAVAALGASMAYVIDDSLGYGLVPNNVSMPRFLWGSAATTTLIVAVVLRYLYVNDGWAAQVRASARAEADALQARIKPHFLFNSMNTIAGLVRSDPVVAERAVLDLSDLFRAALGAGESDSTLREEIELCERYFAIEQLRLRNRLRVAWRKAEPLPWRMPMPRLVLQPLLENAVLHGISRLPGGGEVEVELAQVGDELAICIRNPAPPPREGDILPTLDAGNDAPRTGNRHAQFSIAQRLRYAYGPGARMTAAWHEGYYQVDLRLPVATAGAGSPEGTGTASKRTA
ncbi:sensor histidine kinase [Lysobacter yangpyeongensis]|uniref:Sensor histidine kinase n=1 Tax=Lysobacter yangpyeongensis TaxID=346182 RepID=A0ABW0SNR4_9GAMM